VSPVQLLVVLGGERYAVPVDVVLEVVRVGRLTAVPAAPRAVLGVVNLRGEVLPVLDVAGLVGLAPAAPDRSIVVVEHAGRRAGLAVEALLDVAPLPAVLDEAEGPCLLGSALVDGSLVGVLDVGALFDAVQCGAPA
jgi:chemotaxis signal transduction protein